MSMNMVGQYYGHQHNTYYSWKIITKIEMKHHMYIYLLIANYINQIDFKLLQ